MTDQQSPDGMRVPGAPSIAQVAPGLVRPLWSVMIPTFNCASYLAKTLQSVLDQDAGRDHMQIEVVDDCSTQDDPAAVVEQIGKGRVDFYRREQNGGVNANFNTCLNRSRGQLVHILHGDDYVNPLFYERIEQAHERHADVSLFFTRCFIVDASGNCERLTDRIPELEQPTRDPGSLPYHNAIATPGVVVTRSFYETYGGFLPQLRHTGDWEMWVRAITLGKGCCINMPLATYRMFPGSDTGKLTMTAGNLRDFMRLSEVFSQRVADFDSARFNRRVQQFALAQAHAFKLANHREAYNANMRFWRSITSPSQQVVYHAKHMLKHIHALSR